MAVLSSPPIRERKLQMGQPVLHFEIGCRDSAKSAAFFSGLFGWNMQAMGPATMINTGADNGIHGHITALGHEWPASARQLLRSSVQSSSI
jgi:hypothetical protein